MSTDHLCRECSRKFLWHQGNPQELTLVEQMICVKEDLPIAGRKKITCPYCNTQSLTLEPGR